MSLGGREEPLESTDPRSFLSSLLFDFLALTFGLCFRDPLALSFGSPFLFLQRCENQPFDDVVQQLL